MPKLSLLLRRRQCHRRACTKKIQNFVEWGDQRPLAIVHTEPGGRHETSSPSISATRGRRPHTARDLAHGAGAVAGTDLAVKAAALAQPVIVENRPGASTNIAVQAVVNAPPDGYTLLWHGLSSVVNASLFVNLPFDIQRDIAPVAGIVSYPMIMVAHPSVPAKNAAELIALAKADPGKVTMASFGTGSASHLAGELFKFMAGINMQHVPYRGGAPMTNDLVGGQVNVGFDVMVTALPQVKSGRLRALGVLSPKRFEALPDVAAVAETLPGYEANTWAGVGVPQGTPPEIIERLNREVNDVLAQPEIKARFADVGTVPMVLSAAEFRAYIAAEFEKWDKVVKVAGIKLD
jgi:tripartite-type tricarboxylate transporter receptor subunit TctC